MFIVNLIRGFFMALADSVPGVSGGTIAFILGFYDEFIGSLNTLVSKNSKEEKIQAIQFLLKIGIGWAVGMIISVLFLASIFEEHIYEKIKSGLVPGATDPAEASDIIRRGRLTYQQAVDLTRPLTAESLAYDAAGGALVSLCAMMFSFFTASASAFFRTRNIKKALQAGLRTASQALGRVFGQHLLISQLARTDLAASLLPAAEAAVDPLPRETVKALSASVRFLTGKEAATISVAEGQLARMLRTGIISSAAVFLLLTIPDAFRTVTRRISIGQFIKNTVCRLFSLTGGTLKISPHSFRVKKAQLAQW